MWFDETVDFIATLFRLDFILALKQEGFRDAALLLLGFTIGFFVVRVIYKEVVRYWKDRALAAEAQRAEAVNALDRQLKQTQKAQTELHSAKATIANQSIQITTLNTQLDQILPEGSVAVSAATFQRLIDGRLWSRPVAEADAHLIQRTSGIPILAVGNLKGGVGKTTCAANLGAIFARSNGPAKRVLFIDFDFQSSLSGLLNAVSQTTPSETVENLMDPTRPVDTRVLEAKPLSSRGLANGCAFYDVSMKATTLFEDRITLRWMLRDLELNGQGGDARGPTNGDMRLILKAFLLSDAVQSRYDLVIIDMPPRNSALAYNALLAATDLLIVTRPDAMSSDSIPRFITYLEASRPLLMPNLRIAGVAVNGVTGHAGDWAAVVQPIVEGAFAEWNGQVGLAGLLPPISQTVHISSVADRAFAVLGNQQVRNQFEALAESLKLFDDGQP